jgi:gliding motility-associated-like protein
MIVRFLVNKLLLFVPLIILCGFNTLRAQVPGVANLQPPPKFTYPTPNVYPLNTPITLIGPTTLGGAVPATIFGKVSTFAGQDSKAGYNDATGSAALFTSLWGIDMDASGNLYVADGTRIRKITPGGLVTTLAGGNPNGVSDGTGAAAGFGLTAGLSVAPSGDIFVGDVGNKSVRQITPAGAVTTFAGSGINNFDPAGAATDASGNIFITDEVNDLIREFPATGPAIIYAGSQNVPGATNGPALFATFNNPADLEFDGLGNLYVADQRSNMIRVINAANIVSTVAGAVNPGLQDGPVASALFRNPIALALDAVNNIYVSDANGLVIRMIDARGVVVSIAGNNANQISRDGIGPLATFFKVSGLVYTNGVLYAADKTCVREITVTGYSIDKPLPSGLVFDSATGTISGTPNVITPTTQYTITGYNTGGSYATTISITVDLPLPPIITYPSPQVYTRNMPIVPLTPTNKGGAPSSTSTSTAYTIDQTLPTGLALDPSTGIISGTPTTISPPTDYNITAHNDGGTNTFTVNITVVAPILPDEVITFNALPVKTYGDADFPPGATSNDNLVPIIYTSDDPTIATIVNGQIHIAGAGTTNITATQPGDINYNAAYPVIQILTVKQAVLTITTDNVSRFVGQPNPVFIPHYSGFVNSETAANLTSPPIITTTATEASPPGDYAITISGAASLNYDIHPIAGTLTVVAVPPTVVIPNAFTPNGDGINDLWNIKSIEAYPQCIISVYSRYGALVYQSKGYPRSWDGTSNGSPVPTGTYYFIINLNEDNSKPLTGYVAVIR